MLSTLQSNEKLLQLLRITIACEFGDIPILQIDASLILLLQKQIHNMLSCLKINTPVAIIYIKQKKL